MISCFMIHRFVLCAYKVVRHIRNISKTSAVGHSAVVGRGSAAGGSDSEVIRDRSKIRVKDRDHISNNTEYFEGTTIHGMSVWNPTKQNGHRSAMRVSGAPLQPTSRIMSSARRSSLLASFWVKS